MNLDDRRLIQRLVTCAVIKLPSAARQLLADKDRNFITAAILNALLAGAALFAALPATAQRYGRPVETVENRAIGALRGSSRCAAAEAPPSARKVLDTQLASDEEKKRVRMLMAVARKCYPASWPDFPPTLVRGAIAESLYLDAHRETKPKSITGPAPASFGVVPAGTRGTPEQEIAWTLAAVANCVVFADAADVHHLLIGPAAVDEETKRFDALRPAIGRCLPAAQAAVLKPATFRGYLADALYRQATTQAR
ncbi:MAG: hypothetical protein V4537_05010 [Pseudomonadota bacterium]